MKRRAVHASGSTTRTLCGRLATLSILVSHYRSAVTCLHCREILDAPPDLL